MPASDPGSSRGGPLAKRVAAIELILSRFDVKRVRLKGTTGKWGTYLVLAKVNGTADEDVSAPPFSLVSLTKDGANFKVVIAPGWLRDIITKGGEGVDGVLFLMPKAGDKELSADPPPEISMKMGDYLYCHYSTDKKGNVTGDATMVADNKDKKSVHYQPDTDGEGGADGDYWIKVGKLETVDGKVKWKPYQNSDIEHYHELPSFKNVGDGSAIFKERDPLEDAYKMRRVRGLYGLTDDQESDRIALNVDVENVGDGEKLVVVDEGGSNKGIDGAMQVRSIRGAKPEDMTGGSGSPQIKVQASENTLIVKGNTKKGSLSMNDCEGNFVATLLEWEDGLVTTEGAQTFVAGCDGSSSSC